MFYFYLIIFRELSLPSFPEHHHCILNTKYCSILFYINSISLIFILHPKHENISFFFFSISKTTPGITPDYVCTILFGSVIVYNKILFSSPTLYCTKDDQIKFKVYNYNIIKMFLLIFYTHNNYNILNLRMTYTL